MNARVQVMSAHQCSESFAAQCLLAAAAAFAAAAVAALPIRARSQPSQETRPGLLSGAREILHRPTLRIVTLSSTLGQLGPGALAVVAAVLATSLNRQASSGLLLTAVAAGSFIGSLLYTWHPIAPDRSPLVTTASMIGIGTPIALAAATPSIQATAVLFGLSGIFIGPFGAALFTARTHYSDEAVRTQVFTLGAGLKVTASAIGAALIGLLTDLSIGAQLLLVASSPLFAGVLGTLLLTFGPDTKTLLANSRSLDRHGP
jgi:MFS family permease